MKRIGSALIALLATVGTLEAQDQPPRFRARVDVLPVDVTVVDNEGRQVRDLTAADFAVSVGGTPRRVLSAEWIPLAGGPAPAAVAVPEGYSSNENATGGRLIVLAIDQPNIRVGGGRAITDAMVRFLDRLPASDRVALVALGRGTASIPFTTDRARIKDAVTRINGQKQAPVQSSMTGVSVSLTTAVRLARGDTALMERLLSQCPLGGRNGADTCEQEITRYAEELVIAATQERDATLKMLGALLTGLKTIDAPKALVLVSEGLALFEGDGDATSELADIGSLAAAARTTMYALRLGDQVFDASRSRSDSPLQDAEIRTRGLEQLTASARGTMFNVTTTGAVAFERIESELSGYYLLSLEASPADSERASAALRVQVARKGVVVRARSSLAPGSATPGESPSPLLAAASALMSPLSISGLPVRAITFNFQGTDPSTVQLLIHADIGRGYTAPQSIAVAYMVLDTSGAIVATDSLVTRLGPAVAGLPSALPFSAGVGLAPGDYILKIAVADGALVGSVEHPVHASLAHAGAAALSDLTAGGPVPSTSVPSRPTVDDTVRFGTVHGYVEAYGADADQTAVRYEVAVDDQAAALIFEDTVPRRVNPSRVSFSKLLVTRALPPGRYRLRAIVSVKGAPVTTLTRAFDIAGPEAIAASPGNGTAATLSADSETFLPMEAGDLVAPFRISEALEANTLRVFTDLVPATAKASFEEGVVRLRAVDYVAAETRFKTAIRENVDFVAAVTYLGVTFAASGHDLEAAGAWQTALAGGSRGNALPQLYLWIGQALLRVREFPQARLILEEASGNWPQDVRFARPLAMLNATTGKAYDALSSLQRYLSGNPADAEALFLGVEWIYHLRLNGQVFRDDAADLALAHNWRDAYVQANGPKQPLVNQWLQYLANH